MTGDKNPVCWECGVPLASPSELAVMKGLEAEVERLRAAERVSALQRSALFEIAWSKSRPVTLADLRAIALDALEINQKEWPDGR